MRYNNTFKLALVAAILIGLTGYSLLAGVIHFNVWIHWRELFGHPHSVYAFTLWELRLPRIILAIVGGALFAASGVLLQAVIRNPLASPDVIGITPGAGLMVVTMMTFFPQASNSVIAMTGMIGAALGFSAVYFLARSSHGLNPQLLAVIGIIASAFFLAIHHLILVNSVDGAAASPLTFLAGSIYDADWQKVDLIAPLALLLLPAAFLFCRRLDLLTLGDIPASILGLNLNRTRVSVLWFATFLAGLAVTGTGILAFVGLVAPHMARMLICQRHRFILPMACLLGAVLVLLADTLGRTVFAPIEIPAGIVCSLLGTPYFLWVMRQSARRGR